MITFLILTLPSLIIFTIYIVSTKRSLMKRQIRLETFAELIPRDAVSHSDRDVYDPKRPDSLDVRVSQIIR